MELIERVERMRRQAEKLAKSAADLVVMAEELRAAIAAPAGRQVPAQAIPRPAPTRVPAEPGRTDPVSLEAVVNVSIEEAWRLDIFQVIEKLKHAGIPAVVRKSQVNGTNYIDVTHGDLIQALAPGATAMQYRWYGAGQ